MASDSTQNTEAERYASRISALVVAYGEVPPLWAWSPRVHPIDGYWRQGGGEDYACLFNAWLDGRAWSFEDRLAYVQRWDPPFSWLECVACLLWPDELHDPEAEPTDAHFDRMGELGLGSREDWARCFDVSPEEYPLQDDVSSRWLDGPRERFESVQRARELRPPLDAPG